MIESELIGGLYLLWIVIFIIMMVIFGDNKIDE